MLLQLMVIHEVAGWAQSLVGQNHDTWSLVWILSKPCQDMSGGERGVHISLQV